MKRPVRCVRASDRQYGSFKEPGRNVRIADNTSKMGDVNDVHERYCLPQNASYNSPGPLYGRDLLPTKSPFALKPLTNTSVADKGSVLHDGIRSTHTSLWPPGVVRSAFPSSLNSSDVIPVPVGT